MYSLKETSIYFFFLQRSKYVNYRLSNGISMIYNVVLKQQGTLILIDLNCMVENVIYNVRSIRFYCRYRLLSNDDIKKKRKRLDHCSSFVTFSFLFSFFFFVFFCHQEKEIYVHKHVFMTTNYE